MKTSAEHLETGPSDTAFVIGPGRSGTTLLYKLLCLHPQVAYLSTVERVAPWLPAAIGGRLRAHRVRSKLRSWFQEGGNAYMPHRPLLSRLVPVPVEGEPVYRRHGLPALLDDGQSGRGVAESDGDLASLRATFDHIRTASGSKLFVSKRTANNRRIAQIDALFPGAKYLSLERDGRDVAASLSRVEWWNDHPLWWDPEHRTPLQVTATGADMLRLCAHNWVEETQAIARGLADIAPERVCTIRFEELAASPVPQMARILDFLGLPPSAIHEHAIGRLGSRFGSGNWRRTWSAAQIAMVNGEQAEHLARKGYAV